MKPLLLLAALAFAGCENKEAKLRERHGKCPAGHEKEIEIEGPDTPIFLNGGGIIIVPGGKEKKIGWICDKWERP